MEVWFFAWAAFVTVFVAVCTARLSAVEKRLREHENEAGDGAEVDDIA